MKTMSLENARHYLSQLITQRAKQDFLDWLKETNPQVWAALSK